MKKSVARTDAQFGSQSTDAERWLDTMLHALVFHRTGKKPDLVWYHFSAHAVCYADEQAGPDWPGEVAREINRESGLRPSFLQGHIGDVNPGDGSDWRGEIRQTVAAITPALKKAIAAASPRRVDCLRTRSTRFDVPFDMDLFARWVDEYRRDPSKCQSGPWVDAGFAADWYRGNQQRDQSVKHLPITLTAIQLGPVGMLLHPAELYSYYGLAIRRDSPLKDTLVVGCADGSIGYLPDPEAYRQGEYSALVVPKIVDSPPYQPTAVREMTAAAIRAAQTDGWMTAACVHRNLHSDRKVGGETVVAGSWFGVLPQFDLLSFGEHHRAVPHRQLRQRGIAIRDLPGRLVQLIHLARDQLDIDGVLECHSLDGHIDLVPGQFIAGNLIAVPQQRD